MKEKQNLAKPEDKEFAFKVVKAHFASLMGICHLKMLNWRRNTRSTEVDLCFDAIL